MFEIVDDAVSYIGGKIQGFYDNFNSLPDRRTYLESIQTQAANNGEDTTDIDAALADLDGIESDAGNLKPKIDQLAPYFNINMGWLIPALLLAGIGVTAYALYTWNNRIEANKLAIQAIRENHPEAAKYFEGVFDSLFSADGFFSFGLIAIIAFSWWVMFGSKKYG